MLRKLSKVLGMVTVLTLVAAACGGGDEPKAPSGKTGGAAVADLSDPGDLDPGYCGTTSCAEPVGLLFDSLLSYDEKTAALEKNGAAEDYKVNAEATVVTLQLRKDGKFQNGEPVTAESFIRAMTRVAVVQKGVTPSELSFHLEGIKGFTAAQEGKAKTLPGVRQGKDAYELVIELEAPNAEFVTRLGHQVFSPVPAAANTADGKPDPKFTTNPIGNGPYQMDGEYKRNQGLKVKRWSGYTGSPKGFLDSVEWRVFSGEQALDNAYLEFQGATLDSANVPPQQFAAAEQAYGNAFIQQPGSSLTYLTANTTKAPTNNPKFRQAVSMAINRQDIIDAVFNGNRVAADSIIPPTTVGYQKGACTFCKFNLTEAKKLLAEAGGAPAPGALVLSYNEDGGHADWIEAVRVQLEQNLGIKAAKKGVALFSEYTGSDPKVYMRSSFLAKPHLGRLGWAQDYPTPDNWLFPLLHSRGGNNYGKYSNPTFDGLVEQAERTIDPAARLKLQQQAEDIAVNDLPIIPMWYTKSAVVYNKDKFANFPVDVQYQYPVWELISIK